MKKILLILKYTAWGLLAKASSPSVTEVMLKMNRKPNKPEGTISAALGHCGLFTSMYSIKQKVSSKSPFS